MLARQRVARVRVLEIGEKDPSQSGKRPPPDRALAPASNPADMLAWPHGRLDQTGARPAGGGGRGGGAGGRGQLRRVGGGAALRAGDGGVGGPGVGGGAGDRAAGGA